MGISYKPIAMYGKYFKTRNDLTDFVCEIYPEAEVDYDCIGEVPQLEDIEIECLNAYSGEEFLLGYKVPIGETVDVYKEKWDNAFPGVEAEIHHEVRIS